MLNKLNAEWLKKTISNEFNGPYYSEAQIQFELALLIKENFKDCKISLEHFSMLEQENDKGKLKSKRDYTDIFVFNKDKSECVAIELKYKTKKEKNFEETDECKTNYTDQGATDLGRFDYLWDINRLELLTFDDKYKKENEVRIASNKFRNKELLKRDFISQLGNSKLVSSYAIIITNDEKYWTYTKNENLKGIIIPNICGNYKYAYKDKSVQYQEFCIAQGDRIQSADWQKNDENKYKSAVIDTFRGRKLQFINPYTFEWNDIPNKPKKVGDFKFCITEVKKDK